jgi:pyridoxine kinase
MTDPTDKPPVIVVSSHVARGAVGNRAAVFALERLGFPVIAVPTAVLAWHPGEGPATRIVPPGDAFAALVGDLIGDARLAAVGGVLSGYLGAAGQARPVAALVAAVKARNPRALYLCDPVCGDLAGAYVPADVVAAIGEQLLPLADIATPNRHELGLLLGKVLPDNDALIAAARAAAPGEVLVTSAFAARGEAANLLVTPDCAYYACHASIADAPHGTGDLLAALYLAHRLGGTPASAAFGRAVSSTFSLIGIAGGSASLPLAGAQGALVEPDRVVPVEPIG